MVDFLSSFNEGLDAALAAENNKIEIDSVFEELNKQLSEAGNNIRVDRLLMQIESNTSLFTKFAVNAALGNPGAIPSNPKRWFIVAWNTVLGEKSAEKLASWSRDKYGYPCVINFGENKLVCENKEALEQAIAELLREPFVGVIMNKLRKLKSE